MTRLLAACLLCATAAIAEPVTVIAFISAECPVSNQYNDRLSALYRDYSAKGVRFVFVNANRNETARQIAEHAKAVGFPFQVLRDDTGDWAAKYDAQVTPETFVLDAKGAVVYRGQVDDSRNEARVTRRPLRMALDAVIAGQPVPIAQTKAFGCTIKRAKRNASSALTPLDEAGYQNLVAAHKSKVAIYSFWATWCQPCRAEIPALLKLEAKLKARGFELVLISADEPEQEAAAAKILAQYGVAGATYRKQAQQDEKFIDAIDPQWSGALPALFLYSRSGKKVRSFIGETDSAILEAAITRLL